MILGVAAVWDRRKGLEEFIKLNDLLDFKYQIILVGLHREQINDLPSNIIGIERTNSVENLAALYAIADVFINPTLEDNYPTTNIEAIACETPVITFETGGSPESARIFGTSVPKKDLIGLIQAIKNLKQIGYKRTSIDYKYTVKKYVNLYEDQ